MNKNNKLCLHRSKHMMPIYKCNKHIDWEGNWFYTLYVLVRLVQLNTNCNNFYKLYAFLNHKIQNSLKCGMCFEHICCNIECILKIILFNFWKLGLKFNFHSKLMIFILLNFKWQSYSIFNISCTFYLQIKKNPP